jgi:hypothetical protein
MTSNELRPFTNGAGMIPQPDFDMTSASNQRLMAENQQQEDGEPDDENQFDSTLQDRINALRERTKQQPAMESEENEDRNTTEVIQPCEADVDYMHSGAPPGPKPADYQHQLSSPTNGDLVEYPLVSFETQASFASIPYPVATLDSLPKYPANNENVEPPYSANLGETSYPIESDVVAPYPVDLREVSYPIDSTDLTSVGGAGYGYPLIDVYPVIDAYPIHNDVNGIGAEAREAGDQVQGTLEATSEQQQKQPPKLQQVDKDIISLLPTHLQRKRKATKLGTNQKPKSSRLINQGTAPLKDQFDEFIKDVDNI